VSGECGRYGVDFDTELKAVWLRGCTPYGYGDKSEKRTL